MNEEMNEKKQEAIDALNDYIEQVKAFGGGSAMKRWVKTHGMRRLPDNAPNMTRLKAALESCGARDIADDLYVAVVRDEYNLAYDIIANRLNVKRWVLEGKSMPWHDVALSELINVLQDIKDEHGDVMVYAYDSGESVSDPVRLVYCPSSTCVVLTTQRSINCIDK